MKWGLEQVRRGAIKPLLQQALPVEKVAEAHWLVAGGRVQGNLVLLPWE